jgi:MFS family permease
MTNPLQKFPSFRYFFVSRIATTFASQMVMAILGWQMYDLTHSAYDLGLVGLAQFLPSLMLTLVAGHVADRFDRRYVLACCLMVQLAVAASLAAGTMQGWLDREVILLASIALGATRAFQMPTQQALTPLMLPAEELPRGLAVMASGTQTAIVLGPATGGFLYAAGAQVVYSISALLFIAATVAVLFTRIERAKADRVPMTIKTVFAGITFIWQRKDILGAISLDLFAVLLGGAVALLPVFAKDILHVGAWGLGLLRGAPAAGALLMSVYLAKHPIVNKVGKKMFAAVAIYGLGTLVFALSNSFVLSLIALAVTGMFDMVSVVIRQSLVQLDTPNEMRGRVSAVNSIFIGASNQLGEFESGLAAAYFGAVPSVLIGGIGTLAVVGIWMLLFPSLTQRDRLMLAKGD